MSNKESYKSKVPVVVIDNSLAKYKKLPIFQDKLDKANEMLSKIGLPKSIKKNK